MRSYVNPGYPKKIPQPSENRQILGLSQSLRSAPSIPNRFQGYGYDADQNGKLRPQKPLKPGFSGIKGDEVGPGDYDPDNFVAKKHSAAAFSKV